MTIHALLVHKWVADELEPPASGATIIGQASETDNAQALTSSLVRALAQVSEADTAQAFTVAVRRALAHALCRRR